MCCSSWSIAPTPTSPRSCAITRSSRPRLLADLNRSLDRLKTGNARAPALSPEIVEMVKQAWLLASVEQGATRVRSGHLLWALLADETLSRRAREASGQFARIPADC